jgi:hypothetical protein
MLMLSVLAMVADKQLIANTDGISRTTTAHFLEKLIPTNMAFSKHKLGKLQTK